MIEKRKESFALLLSSLLFSYYLFTVYTYTSFMPISDDYGAIIGFLNHYVSEADSFEKIKMLFWQHNEHRIVFNRIIEVLQLKCTGKVNFTILTFIGNLGWILTISLLYVYAKRDKIITIYTFYPILLFLLAFSHAALMTWAMAGLQQYWQLFFSVASIYFLTQNRYIWAILLMLFAIFTGGGGFALIPVFIFYFIFQKNWKYLTIFILLCFIIVWVYFIALDYQKPVHAQSTFWVLTHYYNRIFLFALTFLGNFTTQNPWAMYTGGFLVVLFLYQVKSIFQHIPFVGWSIVFILIISVLVGVSRSTHGINQALPSRYSIYSVLLLSMVYIAYLKQSKNKKVIFFIGLLVGILLFGFSAYKKIPAFEHRKHIAETKLDHPATSVVKSLLMKSSKLGVFEEWKKIKFPSDLVKVKKVKGLSPYCIGIGGQIRICDGLVTNYNTQGKIENKIILFEHIARLHIDGWMSDVEPLKDACAMMNIINGRKTIVYLQREDGLSNKLEKFNHMYSKIDTYINTSNLKQGQNLLEIKTINHECNGYYDTITIPLEVKKLEEVNKLPIVYGKTKGYIETLNIGVKNLSVKGWFVILDQSIDANVIVEIDGKKYVALYGGNRPDVASALGNKSYRRSGFRFEFPAMKLSKGTHVLKLYMLSFDQRKLYATQAQQTFDIE